ncbi:MAG: hypothetical protein M1837_004014 [Sclerophora amabilis]|nr:MAG: hypothetical protein M1837_004014 [Sclerophora amabilis]
MPSSTPTSTSCSEYTAVSYFTAYPQSASNPSSPGPDQTLFNLLSRSSSRSKSPSQERSSARSVPESQPCPPSPTQTIAFPASLSRANSKKDKRGSGTYLQCGRHSNQWLFGGISVRDAVKGLFVDEKKL